jgi:subtilisin family serine protease
MKQSLKYALTGAAFAVLAACGGGSSPPSDSTQPTATANGAGRISSLRVEGGASQSVLDSRLQRASGPQRVWVTLADPSLAAFKSTQLEALGVDMQARSLGVKTDAQALSASERTQKSALATHRDVLRARQSDMMNQLRGYGAQELGRVHVAHNAIAVKVDATSLKAISQLSGVVKVRPVVDYTLDLSETVPYVGGTAVQTAGRTGAGVKVAVLDSGIDYTHKNLGGPGTAAAYAAAYGTGTGDPLNTTRNGLFPTAKVIAGYDFVGEDWPNTPEAPDEDPIDFEGHGTHVADIIAGNDGAAHKGMAPGASLVAVKVCSAVATSCSGVALLQGMDFALDPNGNGDISDAVDVINMSLGSSYGQIEDDLTLAAATAVKLGVVVVVSAGNSANRPYIVGSPSTGVGVISVAQTQTPSAVAIALTVNTPANIARTIVNTASVEFAPITSGFSGDIRLASTAAGGGNNNNLACAALPAASLAGMVALIDRGTCAVSVKVHNAATAGAVGVLVANNADGDPPTFSFGGPVPFTPAQTLIITRVDGALLKGSIAAPVNVTVSPTVSLALVGGVVASSSRGPAYSTQHIKPEIGAPGASVSAEVGTGIGQTAFGGTSGAAPMVSGAAALMIEAFPTRSPEQIKAMLMNSAETNVYTSPAGAPGELAPITRIGAGELRVNRAIALTSAAWNKETRSAALSYGALEVPFLTTVSKKLRVENFGNSSKNFTITSNFRYTADQATGAVRVLAPSRVRVGARSTEDIEIRLVIDPSKLPTWALDGGPNGGNGALLNGPEYDGYVTLTAGSEKLSVPWHVLPRKASLTTSLFGRHNGADAVWLTNLGREVGSYDVFSLTGVSNRIPSSQLPGPGANAAVIDMRSVGVRYLPDSLTGIGADVLEFAISTSGRRAHPNYPAEFDIEIDTDGDGSPDYVVFNAEGGGFAASGQNQVFLADLNAGGPARSFFFTDADLNSGNVIFTVALNIGPGSIALAPGATLNFSVFAFDNYFSGNLTDSIEGMRFTPASPRFGVIGDPFGNVPSLSRLAVPFTEGAANPAASNEKGFLFMYRRNALIESEVVLRP